MPSTGRLVLLLHAAAAAAAAQTLRGGGATNNNATADPHRRLTTSHAHHHSASALTKFASALSGGQFGGAPGEMGSRVQRKDDGHLTLPAGQRPVRTAARRQSQAVATTVIGVKPQAQEGASGATDAQKAVRLMGGSVRYVKRTLVVVVVVVVVLLVLLFLLRPRPRLRLLLLLEARPHRYCYYYYYF